MKLKRFISLLLLLTALLTALPANALAAEYRAAAAPMQEFNQLSVSLKAANAVPGIALNQTSVRVFKGKRKVLKVTGYTGKVTWVSSKPEVASVSKGVVTGLKYGTTTITAKLADGKKLTCKVSVIRQVEGSVYKLDRTNAEVTVKLVNNTSTKKIKKVEMVLKQYDKNGKLLKSPYERYVAMGPVPAGKTYGVTFPVNAKTRTVKVCIKNVIYTDKTTWQP